VRSFRHPKTKKVIYASSHGKRAFRLLVREK
jgi:hypothetical protein